MFGCEAASQHKLIFLSIEVDMGLSNMKTETACLIGILCLHRSWRMSTCANRQSFQEEEA